MKKPQASTKQTTPLKLKHASDESTKSQVTPGPAAKAQPPMDFEQFKKLNPEKADAMLAQYLQQKGIQMPPQPQMQPFMGQSPMQSPLAKNMPMQKMMQQP